MTCRNGVVAFAAAIALLTATPALTGKVAFAQATPAQKVLKFIPEADLRSLDPIWTTAYITRNHGYMVYDTLFATDKDFKSQPQMAEGFTLSDDKKTYTIKLRPGLKFHDGQPVRPADCIASITRWGKRDALGQKVLEQVAEMKAVDDLTFTISLKAPFPLLIDALAKLSSNVPFIMREKEAMTDPFQQVTEAIGSGPFKFVKEEWVPGSKVVYAKNTDYVPRKEPPSWAAGGKVVKVDRVEWIYIPDSATASSALNSGEVDWWQQLPPDLIPVLAGNKDITVANVDPLGSGGIFRFNHLYPPFNNVKMRQAVMAAVDQQDFMRGVAGDDKNWKTCFSFFTCGTPMASEAGAEMLKGKRDIAKAKQLVAESGYKGEKVVVLSATDQPIVHNQALVTMEVLKSIGVNAELQASDWGTLITRRASKEPSDKGGWNIFFTWIVGPDLVSPAVNFALRSNGAGGWFGWADFPKIEELRNQWFAAPDLASQQKVAAELQTEAFKEVPYIPTGQFIIPTAYRKNLDGLIVAPVAFLWNVEKK